MFEIFKMSSDKFCVGRCGSDNFSVLFNGYFLSEGIRVRFGINVVYVIENDVCISVFLRRVFCNKIDRFRLVGYRIVDWFIYV